MNDSISHGGVRPSAGRKRKIVISETDAVYIRANYKSMSVSMIARNINRERYEVANFMSEEGLSRERKQRGKILSGFFNVSERENWAI